MVRAPLIRNKVMISGKAIRGAMDTRKKYGGGVEGVVY